MIIIVCVLRVNPLKKAAISHQSSQLAINTGLPLNGQNLSRENVTRMSQIDYECQSYVGIAVRDSADSPTVACYGWITERKTTDADDACV